MKISLGVQENDLDAIYEYLDKGKIPEKPFLFNAGGPGLLLDTEIKITVSYDEYMRLKDLRDEK